MTERTRAPLLVAVIACAPFIPTHSHAQGMAAGPNDGEHATDADRASEFEWKRFQTRFAYFDQRGRGPQSRAGSRRGRGSEDLQIYQPIARLEVGQGPDIDHAVTVPVDVVSAASADALDAVSRASLVNESGGFDYAGTWRATGDDTFGLRAGVLVEEPLRAGSLGLRYRRDLADDNASIAGSFNAVYDHRKNIFYDGEQETGEFVDRWTANANLSGHQVLSATTLLHLSYGLTYQRGALETTWNSLPVRRRRGTGTLELRIRAHHLRATARSDVRDTSRPASSTCAVGLGRPTDTRYAHNPAHILPLLSR